MSTFTHQQICFSCFVCVSARKNYHNFRILVMALRLRRLVPKLSRLPLISAKLVHSSPTVAVKPSTRLCSAVAKRISFHSRSISTAPRLTVNSSQKATELLKPTDTMVQVRSPPPTFTDELMALFFKAYVITFGIMSAIGMILAIGLLLSSALDSTFLNKYF